MNKDKTFSFEAYVLSVEQEYTFSVSATGRDLRDAVIKAADIERARLAATGDALCLFELA